MRREIGVPLPLGVTIEKESVNFSVAVPEKEQCCLLLYEAGKKTPCNKFEMAETVGEVRFLKLSGFNPSVYEYNYQIGQRIVVDPYARALAGRDIWKKERDIQKHEVRGILYDKAYDWQGDTPLHIPYCNVIAYSLHVRGFTKHSSSKISQKGTFAGVIEKIPYMKELGINQIHCMPLYEFEECQKYTNYWGYGNAWFFAPKSAYAASQDAVRELKDMVRFCHQAGIEVVLEMPFTEKVPKQMIEECLRYYMLEYHIDGFIVNPSVTPMDAVRQDPILKRTKIMKHDIGFQTVMRRFLKGDEGMIKEVIYWLRHHSKEEGSFNYVASHTGFTLNDAVSYDGKHNELNGEDNLDGPDYNYSWNCGAEGPTRKGDVIALRKTQMKNAFFLLLLAQGTPCILAGDEFANTQKGNNNVYCQDNPTAWLDWKKAEKEEELSAFVKGLIRIRQDNSVLHQPEELRGMDQMRCGVPDISYHGESAWKTPSEVFSRQLGVYYHAANPEGTDCFIVYNMHWVEHSFALPVLEKGKKWYKLADTKGGIAKKPELLKNQRIMEVGERTIVLLMGHKEYERENRNSNT